MLYYEDFIVGQVREYGSYRVTAGEMVAFASRYDPQPFHVDPQRAERSIYGGLIASGWHTVAITTRILCDGFLLDTASMGSPGIDELKWLKPVRDGDVLSVRTRAIEKRPSASRSEIGVVKHFTEVLNQSGEVVMTIRGTGFIQRRPANQGDDPPAG